MQRQQIHRLLASFTGAVRIHPHAEPIRKSSPILCSGLARMKTSVSNRFDSLSKNISITAAKVYPGWIVRIYHNFHNQSQSENVVHKQLCDLHCQFDHVDLCSVTDIARNIPSLTLIDPSLLRGLNGRMFRFLVMLDPDVDIFISRDIDSVIWHQREVDAVDQWQSSNFTFHLMRDHKFHSATILAGL